MALDSDISNADSHLHVEFYEHDRAPYKGVPFVRILIPGDKTNEIDQPVREDHKARFPRQWLHYAMKNSDPALIGTPLEKWHKAQPDDFTDMQMAEIQIYKFQTVEQLATASDSQLQRVGMGAVGLRERARQFLALQHRSADAIDLAETKNQLALLQEQMREWLQAKQNIKPAVESVIERGPGEIPTNLIRLPEDVKRRLGRPPKERNE